MDFTVIADPQCRPRIPVTIEGDHIVIADDENAVAHQVFSIFCEGESLLLTRAQMEALLCAGPRILAQPEHAEPAQAVPHGPAHPPSLFALAGVSP